MNTKTDVELDEINNICKELTGFMNEYEEVLKLINTLLTKTKEQWNGDDYKEFELKYKKIVSSKSAASVAKKQLDLYYRYLSEVQKLYSDAKERTMNYVRKLG